MSKSNGKTALGTTAEEDLLAAIAVACEELKRVAGDTKQRREEAYARFGQARDALAQASREEEAALEAFNREASAHQAVARRILEFGRCETLNDVRKLASTPLAFSGGVMQAPMPTKKDPDRIPLKDAHVTPGQAKKAATKRRSDEATKGKAAPSAKVEQKPNKQTWAAFEASLKALANNSEGLFVYDSSDAEQVAFMKRRWEDGERPGDARNAWLAHVVEFANQTEPVGEGAAVTA